MIKVTVIYNTFIIYQEKQIMLNTSKVIKNRLLQIYKSIVLQYVFVYNVFPEALSLLSLIFAKDLIITQLLNI